MGSDERKPVSVSRRIETPAADIFKLLADPNRHPEFDGSGMPRPGASNRVIVGVGDVFVTETYFEAMGDYEITASCCTRRTGASPGSLETPSFLGMDRVGGTTSLPMARMQLW